MRVWLGLGLAVEPGFDIHLCILVHENISIRDTVIPKVHHTRPDLGQVAGLGLDLHFGLGLGLGLDIDF